MKLQIALFVLAATALCSASEKIKGQRNDDSSPFRGRYFHKKGNKEAAQPTIILLESPSSSYTYDSEECCGYDSEEEEVYDVSGTLELSTSTTSSRGLIAYDDDVLDSDDEIENEQTSKRQNNYLKRKKMNGKKQIKIQKNTPVSNSAATKKNINKLPIVRLNGNHNRNVNRNSENIGIRRLVIRQ